MVNENEDVVTMPDMLLDDAEKPKPPSVGRHKAILTEVDTTYSKEDADLPKASRRRNFVLKLELAPDAAEMPGYKLGNSYVPIPTDVEADFHFKHKAELKDKVKAARLMADNPEMFSSDGRTKYSQKMDWIKKAAIAFGGKEVGKLDKNFFVKQIGTTLQVDVIHVEWQEEVQAKVKFMGLYPA